MAFRYANIIWTTKDEEIKKWEANLYKYVIYILLSSVFIWPFSFFILLIPLFILAIYSIFKDSYEMIKDIFNL